MNYRELFELNLSKKQITKANFKAFIESMNWRKIEQSDPQPGQNSKFSGRLSVGVYGDHLLVFKNEKRDEYDRLYCCNRRRNLFCLFLTTFLDTLGPWSMIDVADKVGLGGIRMIGNSVIYKNKLYACVTNDKRWWQVSLAILDLQSNG